MRHPRSLARPRGGLEVRRHVGGFFYFIKVFELTRYLIVNAVLNKVGTHPHKGMETVTIAFQGEIEHQDSQGNRDVIKSGDVQWMTAGKGIEHSEFHSTKFAKEGGTLEMCQIWVNLPKEHKLTKAGYQAITSDQIAVSPLYKFVEGNPQGIPANESEGCVRIIAGNFHGVKGPARTFSPIDLWDVVMRSGVGQKYTFEIGESYNVMVFVRKGSLVVQGKKLGPQDVAMLGDDGDTVVLEALEPETQVLFLSGQPLNEPIAARGPFVMNTQQELQEAFMDYQMGRFGR